MPPSTVSPPIAAPPDLSDPALRSKLLTHARARLKDPEAAEDAVQEAYARALKQRTKYDPGQSLVGWVFGFLKNVILEEYRKRGKQPAQPPASLDDFEHVASRMGPGSDPHALPNLLAQMPEPDRRIVTMHHLNDLSHEEIGEVLGISVGNSRVRLGRAMHKLKQLAAKEGAR